MTPALIFFEYFLTIGQEVTLFWGKKLTGAVALFFANRYTTILYTLFLIISSLVPAIAQAPQVSFKLSLICDCCKPY